jgi:hypothetical protein
MQFASNDCRESASNERSGTCAKQDQGDLIPCELQSLHKKEAGQYLGTAGQFTVGKEDWVVAMIGSRT